MKEKLLQFGSYVLVAVLATLVTLTMVHLEIGLEPSKLSQLEKLIEEKFIGEADMEALEDAAADAMVKATGDRWSYYIPASEYAAYRERSENAYVGVGMTIQAAEDGSGFLVLEVVAGGPAEEAGIQPKDLLIQVEDTDIRSLEIAQVGDLVKGKEGTYVSLTVLRQGTHETFSVQRRKVETPVATGQLLENNIGLITIENFDERCADESIKAIETLLEDGAEKLIFDVRNNPGGYADELVELLDYLLPEGDLFRWVRYYGYEHVDKSDADCLEIPMAVLVNQDSYSAAEFFAAALQEYEAAVVVGERTVGKGYFQITHQLSDGSAVALSVGKYFTPNGVSLAEKGVTPDVEAAVEESVAADIYYGLLEPDQDPQIQAAVKVLQ